jgi:hypothetical protein
VQNCCSGKTIVLHNLSVWCVSVCVCVCVVCVCGVGVCLCVCGVGVCLCVCVCLYVWCVSVCVSVSLSLPPIPQSTLSVPLIQPLLPCNSNKQYIFSVCVCSLRYPACNAHAPYCHLWLVQLFYSFSRYLINGTIFGGKKNFAEHKICVLIFSTIFV